MKREDRFVSENAIRDALRRLYLEDVVKNVPAPFDDLRAMKVIERLPQGNYVPAGTYYKLKRKYELARPAIDIQWIPVGAGLVWALECSNCGYQSRDLSIVPRFCPQCGGSYLPEEESK